MANKIISTTLGSVSVKATINFNDVYEVLALTNGVGCLINNEDLSDTQREAVRKLCKILGAMIGSTFLETYLERRNH